MVLNYILVGCPWRHPHTKFERLEQAKETQLRCIACYVCDNLRKNLTVIHTYAMSSHLHCIFLFFLFLRHLVELMPSTWILLWTWMFHVILRHTFTGLDELADLVSIAAVTFWLSCNKSFTSVHEDWFSISHVGVVEIFVLKGDVRLEDPRESEQSRDLPKRKCK